MKLVCDRCGAPLSKYEGSWRWVDFMWMHKCPQDHYTMGHAGTAIPEHVYQELVVAKSALLRLSVIAHNPVPRECQDTMLNISVIVEEALHELSISVIPKKE